MHRTVNVKLKLRIAVVSCDTYLGLALFAGMAAIASAVVDHLLALQILEDTDQDANQVYVGRRK